MITDPIRTPAEALEAAAQWHLDRADECDRDASKRPDSAPLYSMRGLAHRSCAASMRQLASRIPPAPDDEALVKIVAQALWEHGAIIFHPWCETNALERQGYVAEARAVLTALREAGALQ